MATRKIIDIEQNGEKVWPKGHAKAIFMSDGSTVEDAILSNQGSSVPDLSNYATKTDLNAKVDKVNGKQLSTEDFTSALKSKLEGLTNYDDTQLESSISTLRNDFDKLVSGDTTTAIKTFNEVVAFLDGIQDSQDLTSIIASIEQQIAGKMDKVTLAKVATSGSYSDLTNKPTIPAEQVNADWNATSGKAQILNKPTIPSAVTESTVSGWGFTKNKGTVTKVKINGSEKSPDANGLVDLGTIEGGTNSSSKEIVEVELDNIDGLTIELLEENKIYVAPYSIEGLRIYNVAEPIGLFAEYAVIFRAHKDLASITIPSNWKWANGVMPTIESGVIYELSLTTTMHDQTLYYKAVLTPFKSV